MSKKLFIISIVGILILGTAVAAQKCVMLHAGSSCSFSSNGTANWDGTCTYNGTTTRIGGVWVCAATSPGDDYSYSVATEIEISKTPEENRHCWYKMTHPAESKWLNADITNMTHTSCLSNCAGHDNFIYGLNHYYASVQYLFSNILD